ncbi:MAG TPA: CHASE domain-containing protein [Candidatus Saccharimonadales bacterium]
MHPTIKNSATVELNGKNMIICRLEGEVTGTTVADTMRQTKALVAQVTATGYRPLLLIDISKITKQTSEARTHAKALNSMDFERIAISGGKRALVIIGKYIARAGGMDKYTRFFKDERSARRWLVGGDEGIATDSTLAKRAIVAQIMVILASAALLGWYLDVPLLRTIVPGLAPMNPMAAVGVLLLALTFIVMNPGWQKVVWRRLTVTAVSVWSLLLGSSVIIKHFFDVNLGLDTMLFSDKLESGVFSGAVPLSTGVVFVLAGAMLALLLGRQRQRWTREGFYVLSGIIFIITFMVLLGYSFAFDRFYSFRGVVPMALNTALSFICFNFAITALSNPTVSYRRAMKIFNAYWQAIVVGLVLILATGISWQQTKANIASSIEVASNQAFLKVENDLTTKLRAYSDALNGYRGLFAASQDVSPEEFNNYFANSNLARDYPGFLAITYVAVVPDGQKQTFTALTRQRASAAFPQYKGFNLYPENNNVVHYPVLYSEPHTPTTRHGFDLSSEAVRRKTLEEARDGGGYVGSEIINLNASRNDGTSRPGFFIAMPVYRLAGESTPASVRERRERIQGFVLAYFENKQLFGNIFATASEPNAQFIIKEAATGQMVFNSAASDVSADASVSQSSFVEAGGKTWQLQMRLSSSFGLTEVYRQLPGTVLASGFVVAGLAALLVLGQLRRRDQAIETAAQMTEDLNAERNLAVASRNKDEAILASIGDAVFAIDTKGYITLFNPACERISGFTSDEALGRHYRDILHFSLEKTGRLNDGFIHQALQGHVTSMKSHTMLRRKDGRLVSVADSAAPIYDLRRSLLGVIVVFRDVSKEYELDQAKTEFVSLASHQLRTPLSAINWYGELLLGGDAGKLRKDQQEYVREIYEGSQRMIELVSSLLDVSRLDLGKLSNQPAATDMTLLTSNLERELTTSIQTKHLAVIKNVASDLSPVWAEPKLLRMIVQNLLSNAIKYTADNGTVTVTLRKATSVEAESAKLKASGSYFFMSVADTGFGIPKAQQSKIFGKLFRADNVRALDVEGTGLGLYIVKQVTEKLGGRVWFESEENKGTTFYVVLPFRTKTMQSDTKQMGES